MECCRQQQFDEMDCTILLDPRLREQVGIAEWARIPFNWLVGTAIEQRMLFA